MNDHSPDLNRDLNILEQIQKDPAATQASLAAQLGVAIGTINWHLKRLVEKGYVKVRRAERRKLLYLITSEGLALRTHLTLDYIETSFSLYRLVRERMLQMIREVRQQGYGNLRLIGNGDIADVCRLTCLEQGMAVVEDLSAPVVRIQDLKLHLEIEPDLKTNTVDGR